MSEGTKSTTHNCGVICQDENCPICFFNKQIAWIRRNRQGRILTIIDATISDREQRKAIKDLISQELWTWDNKLEQHLFATAMSVPGKTIIQQLVELI